MSTTATAAAVPGQTLEGAFEGLSLAASLGVAAGDVPRWVRRLLTPQQQRWAAARWESGSAVFQFKEADLVSQNRYRKGLTVPLDDLGPLGALEILTCVATDADENIRSAPWTVRAITHAMVAGDAATVSHVDDASVAQLAAAVLRRWQRRIELATADPDTEWDRDEIRLQLVKPGASAYRLRVQEITQPWLRNLLISVLRVRVHSLSDRSISAWVLTAARLSRFLSTRKDRGLNPSALGVAVIDEWVAALRVEPGLSDQFMLGALEHASAFLSQARALGLTDRYQIPASFAVHRQHYPRVIREVRQDRGFPDATFRFLLGSDDLLGSRVLDLAASIPGDAFSGRVFTTAIRLSASFGRRPDELCSLKASRLRVADSGAAELLYTNFKSGRDKVWLPVDARSGETAADWIAALRDRYRDTALDDLALLPALTRNPMGHNSVGAQVLSTWFRRWVVLLEQAIVLARLNQTTGIPIPDLCSLRCRSLARGLLLYQENRITLPPDVAQATVDYQTDLAARARTSMYAPADQGDLPLFPDVFSLPGTRPVRSQRLTHFIPVNPSRFDALGDGWPLLAVRYVSGGIPGVDLGARRVNPDQLQVRLFRHTYLQHLVNLGTDIFLVQELADHANVQTTINSYVRVQDEKLREAVNLLSAHRLTTYGTPATTALPLSSQSSRDMGSNDCTNPQVLALGREGCEYDRMCFSCVHFAADPSNIPDIKTEIRTATVSLQRLEIAGDSQLKPHHVAVLQARRDGWRRMLSVLQSHLDRLEPTERERIETAASIVREFRDRTRSGGLNLGGTRLPSSVSS